MAKVCVIANLFLLTKNDIIVHYNKFANLWIYHANFLNLKGPRVPSKNCKKDPCNCLPLCVCDVSILQWDIEINSVKIIKAI